MSGVNKAILLGRLGKDPETTTFDGGGVKCAFSLATDRSWKNKDGEKQEACTWHNIVAWGKPAEVLAKYMTKGRQIHIIGRIDNRSYEDKEGVTKYISEVVVEDFTFISGKAEEASPEAAPETQAQDGDIPF